MGQRSPVIHDFMQNLHFSEVSSDEPFWGAVYRKAFPNMVGHMACSGSNDSQRAGIDRVIHLSNGKTLYIDEKKRREVWDDFLLEYISVDTTGAPGWMEKDLTIDYLAYAFMPTQRVYLLPWLLLRRAWLNYKDRWLAEYPRKPARNRTYRTWSVAVPIPVVLAAVKTACIIQLG